MNDIIEQKNEAQKKSSHRKYIIAAFILLCFIAGYVYRAMTWTQDDYESQKVSEKIIRKAAALVIYRLTGIEKEPNDFNDKDFAGINDLLIEETELPDIMLLEKFTNLRTLVISKKGQLAVNKIPLWKTILFKLGIIDSSDKLPVDLSHLTKLSNLQTLCTMNCEIIHFEKIKELKNLQTLWLYNARVFDLKSLRELKKLQTLRIDGTQVTDLEPLKGLTNLQELYLTRTKISDLEPIKNLQNLKTLNIINCPNITDRQVEDLQKALPNLKIER